MQVAIHPMRATEGVRTSSLARIPAQAVQLDDASWARAVCKNRVRCAQAAWKKTEKHRAPQWDAPRAQLRLMGGTMHVYGHGVRASNPLQLSRDAMSRVNWEANDHPQKRRSGRHDQTHQHTRETKAEHCAMRSNHCGVKSRYYGLKFRRVHQIQEGCARYK